MSKLFYVHGKTFTNEEEFFKFCRDWPDLPFDLDEFKVQMERRVREADMTNQVRDGKMTNRQAYRILRLCTDWAVEGEDE